ncbi:MAG: VanW family protein [Clostridiales bacterium]|jgi:vancomycin resistance protein VanW|nr:VanW family protein [Clostridiales bacterium]
MARRTFSSLGPAAYAVSVQKERARRVISDLFSRTVFARERAAPLPALVYRHGSLIRRKLGGVDARLQENKAVNLAIAAPLVDGVLIRPGETFSFWKLVGKPTARRRFREGLVISGGTLSTGIGGGMCQFTNLLHWLVLHSPLTIAERRHHSGFDLFPDFGRQVPFGCGTSIFYNYLDYRVRNDTDGAFQFICRVDGEHLRGELRAESPSAFAYHIKERERRFVRVDGNWRRRNKVCRITVDKATGAVLEETLISEADALVMYDERYIDQSPDA